MPRLRRSESRPIVPGFIKKLYMITTEDVNARGLIKWHEDGSFSIINPDVFTESIIPRYYNHSNFQSFVRQLNMHRFKKLRNPDTMQYDYPSARCWTFKHPSFQVGKPELLINIQRPSPATGMISEGNNAKYDENESWDIKSVTNKSSRVPYSHVFRHDKEVASQTFAQPKGVRNTLSFNQTHMSYHHSASASSSSSSRTPPPPPSAGQTSRYYFSQLNILAHVAHLAAEQLQNQSLHTPHENSYAQGTNQIPTSPLSCDQSENTWYSSIHIDSMKEPVPSTYVDFMLDGRTNAGSNNCGIAMGQQNHHCTYSMAMDPPCVLHS